MRTTKRRIARPYARRVRTASVSVRSDTTMPIDFGIDRVATPRLAGRRPELGDLAAYQRIWTDARVDEAVWPEHLRTADRAERFLRTAIAHWERWGFGPWTMLLSGEPIGYAGMRHDEVAGRPEIELMWFVDPDHWGHGYATELAREAVRVAFAVLELDSLVAQTVPGNAGSRSVMEKLGMAHEGETLHAGLPHVVYRLNRGMS
jgi:[ribosomal protein S5]-alanine N-acetyltransferase